MESGPICIACENGEHGTFFSELAAREQKCACACHMVPAVTEIAQAFGSLMSVEESSLAAALLHSHNRFVNDWTKIRELLGKISPLLIPNKQPANEPKEAK